MSILSSLRSFIENLNFDKLLVLISGILFFGGVTSIFLYPEILFTQELSVTGNNGSASVPFFLIIIISWTIFLYGIIDLFKIQKKHIFIISTIIVFTMIITSFIIVNHDLNLRKEKQTFKTGKLIIDENGRIILE